MKKVGRIIRERRRELKMTQAELGEKVGCCYLTISHLEGGSKNVGTLLLSKICNILGLELSAELIDKEEKVLN